MITQKVEIACNGRVRDRMTSANNVVAVYSLQEQLSPRARCLVHDRNHGVWEGSWTARGVSMTSIPEGELGVTMAGNCRIRVANDGEGFHRPGDSAPRTLSLANGNADVWALIKCTYNDAAIRVIACKLDAAGNGWLLGIYSGNVIWYVTVATTLVFFMARPYPITDGLEHFVQGHYRPGAGIARIIIDGVAIGADATGTTEPQITDGDMYIGDAGVGANFFHGTISLVGLGREGNPNLCADLHQCRTWTDITDDVRVDGAPLEATTGSTDLSPLSRIAPPGSMTLRLDNSVLNEAETEGWYTPGHEDAMPGFEERIPIRWTMTSSFGVERVRFIGTVENIRPMAGVRDPYTEIVCETWFKQAMRAMVKRMPVALNITSSDAIKLVLDRSDRPPRAVVILPGDSTFPVVFDDVTPTTTVYELCARITNNEGGQFLESMAGTVVFESRSWRYLIVTPAAEWTDADIDALDPDRGMEYVRNVIPFTITPRRVGYVTTSVLASMASRVRVLPGQPITIELAYRDPDQEAASVGGTDVSVPDATDYTMFANEDGTGDDLSGYVGVAAYDEDIGGSSMKFSVTNTHPSLPGWFSTRVRGRSLKRFDSQTFNDVRDEASVLRFDPLEEPLRFEYQTNLEESRSIAGQLLALLRNPAMSARSATRLAVDATIESDIFWFDAGSMVSVTNPRTGLDGSERHFIKGVTTTIGADGMLRAEYCITRGQSGAAFWMLGMSGYSELGDTTVLA